MFLPQEPRRNADLDQQDQLCGCRLLSTTIPGSNWLSEEVQSSAPASHHNKAISGELSLGRGKVTVISLTGRRLNGCPRQCFEAVAASIPRRERLAQ